MSALTSPFVSALASALFLIGLGACGSAPGASADSSDEAATAASKRKCTAILERILAAPVAPASAGGFDLARGADDSRGMTIDEANAAHCATALPDVAMPDFGGYRAVEWGGDLGLKLWYNIESRVIYAAELGASYTGSVSFQSRAGGAYGTHAYEIGHGQVLRDGAPFSLDWSAGSSPPSTWADEFVDGLDATFMPSAPAGGGGCLAQGSCLLLPDDGGGNSIFVSRALHLTMLFKKGTSVLTGFYTRSLGGQASCATPKAALEAMDYAGIFAGFGASKPNAGYGAWIAGLHLRTHDKPVITWQDADALECNGVSTAAPDQGYGAVQWGPSGEVLLEFNSTTNAAYKVVAKAGYKGTVQASDDTNAFVFGIGSATKNGAPLTVDFTDIQGITAISNAMTFAHDTDCTATSACVVTRDDGAGHSVLLFPDAGLELAFDKDSHLPVSFTAISLSGK